MAANGIVRVGFIGAGNVVNSMHLPILAFMRDKFEPVGLVDIDVERARRTAEEFDVAGVYGSFAEMKDDNPDMELVTVATKPYSTHAPCAIEALEAGCHVYMEKPFTTSLADARRVFEAAERNGRTVCAYQNRRFEVAGMVFQEALDKGVVGDPKLIRRRMSCDRKPSDVLNFGSHAIDQIIWLTGGRKPKEVSATIQFPHEVYDGPAGFFSLVLRYDDGLLAQVEILPNPTQINYFYAAGTEGSYHQDWIDNMADLFRKQMQLGVQDPTWLPERFEGLFPTIFRNMGSPYYLCYEKMYEHLAGGKEQPVSREDTLLQLAILEAMFQSARENRTVEFQAP